MFEVGDAVPLSWQVVNRQQSRQDATVTLAVDRPDGTTASPTVSHDDVGRYSALFVPTQAGRHVVRWSASGAVAQVDTDVLNVAAASAPVALISLAEAREHLNMSDDQHDDDDELRSFIAAASRVVEQYTKQTFARRTVVEDHFVNGRTAVVLRAAPVVSVTSVILLDTSEEVTVSDLPTDLRHGLVTVAGYGWYRFTVVAGEPVVPPEVIKATQIICAHLWQTQRVPAMSATPGFGGVDATAPVSGRGYLIPNQAAQLLGGRAPNPP